MTKHWMATYEYDPNSPHSSKRYETEAVEGSVGEWWIKKIEWYRDWRARGLEQERRCAEEGKPVPLMEKTHDVKLSLIFVHEISEEEYVRLKELT